MPQLPDAQQQRRVRIARHAQIHKILHGLFSAPLGKDRLAHQPSQDLPNFEIQNVWSVQRLAARLDSAVDALARRCSQQPVNCSRGIQNDQRASRS